MDRTNRWGIIGVFFWAIVFYAVVHQGRCGATEDKQSVSILLLDGRGIDAELVSISASEVVIEVDGKKESLLTSAISSLRFPSASDRVIEKTPDSESRLLELNDGTKLYGRQFTGKGNSWLFESDFFEKVTIPTSSLRSLLLTPLIDETQKTAWEDALGDDGSNDALIVVRSTGELVRVGGTIREAKVDQVSFDFDDQKLDMPLERLKGISWLQTEQVGRGTTIQVQLQNRSVLQCKSIEYTSVALNVAVAGDVKLKIPLNSIVQIEFASANIRWVAEIPPIDASMNTPLAWDFSIGASKSALLPRFVKFRRINSSNREALPVDAQNLLFATPGSYVFRIPDGFQTLQASVERPEGIQYRSELLIEVWQEDEKLFSKVLSDMDDVMDVRVGVVPEKRTKLSVSTKGTSNLGTEVQWKQLRVLR